MKTTRLHSVRRSLARSAGASVIVLAAALISAAPVAAQAAAPDDRDPTQNSSCQTTQVQRQGLEAIVWSVLFGAPNPQQETRCDANVTVAHQEQTRGVLPPPLPAPAP
jgi:hypothetical protein